MISMTHDGTGGVRAARVRSYWNFLFCPFYSILSNHFFTWHISVFYIYYLVILRKSLNKYIRELICLEKGDLDLCRAPTKLQCFCYMHLAAAVRRCWISFFEGEESLSLLNTNVILFCTTQNNITFRALRTLDMRFISSSIHTLVSKAYKRRGELRLISLKNKCYIILRYRRVISRSIHTPVSKACL